MLQVNTVAEVLRLYSIALRSRHTALTQSNRASSRGHFIATLRIEGSNTGAALLTPINGKY